MDERNAQRVRLIETARQEAELAQRAYTAQLERTAHRSEPHQRLGREVARAILVRRMRMGAAVIAVIVAILVAVARWRAG